MILVDFRVGAEDYGNVFGVQLTLLGFGLWGGWHRRPFGEGLVLGCSMELPYLRHRHARWRVLQPYFNWKLKQQRRAWMRSVRGS